MSNESSIAPSKLNSDGSSRGDKVSKHALRSSLKCTSREVYSLCASLAHGDCSHCVLWLTGLDMCKRAEHSHDLTQTVGWPACEVSQASSSVVVLSFKPSSVLPELE